LTTIPDCFRSLCYASRFNADLSGTRRRNGADILLSYVVANTSRRPNMAYRLPVEGFGAHKAIGGVRLDLARRSAITRWCRRNVL
jgi:hypothetical protein